MSIRSLSEEEFVAMLNEKCGQVVEVCFITQKHKSNAYKNKEPLNIRRIHLKRDKRLPSSLSSLIYFAKAFGILVTQKKYDIYIVHDIVQGAFVMGLFCKIFRRKSMVTIHGIVEEEWTIASQHKPRLYVSLYLLICKTLAKVSLKWVDMVVVNDRRIEEQLIEKGVEPSRLFTRYVSVDTVKFFKENINHEELQKIKSLYQLPPKYILYVGQLSDWDGLNDFLEGFRRIHRELPATKCVILGEGPLQEVVNSYVRNYKFDEVVIQIPEVPYELMPYFYYDAQIVLLLMHPPQAGVGRITLEALSMEVPVITTDIGVIHEAVIDGETGYRCPLGDIDSMVSRTVSLLKNPQLAANMGRKGRILVKNKFDVDKYIDNWLESLEQLSGDNPKRGLC